MVRRFVLEVSDGQRISTSGNGVIGRNTSVYVPGTELDDPRHVERVTIMDHTKSVSRVHLAFGQYESVFWVMDLESANGVTITYPGEGTFACDPTTRHEVLVGSTVRFGAHSFVLSLE